MGGIGSGRHWHRSDKPTTGDYRQLDVRRFQQEGLLRPGLSFNWRWSRDGETLAWINGRTELDLVILTYRMRTNGGPWVSHEDRVWLEWTACNYGGQRAWFLCPGPGCSKRTAILYGGDAGFACRRCYQLAYECQRETPYDRALRRAKVIRVKLGGSGDMTEDFPEKPKGMHWRTYNRLRMQAKQAAWDSWPPWVLRMVQPRMSN